MSLLFSYGTLQQDSVQLATLGRLLTGSGDAIVGYELSSIAIDDPAVVAASGKSRHPIVRFTGSPSDHVEGLVFEVSDVELARADRYEVGAYRRVRAQLLSGRKAWVYVDRRFVPRSPP